MVKNGMAIILIISLISPRRLETRVQQWWWWCGRSEGVVGKVVICRLVWIQWLLGNASSPSSKMVIPSLYVPILLYLVKGDVVYISTPLFPLPLL